MATGYNKPQRARSGVGEDGGHGKRRRSRAGAYRRESEEKCSQKEGECSGGKSSVERKTTEEMLINRREPGSHARKRGSQPLHRPQHPLQSTPRATKGVQSENGTQDRGRAGGKVADFGRPKVLSQPCDGAGWN